jgi:hypothetical protein
VRVLRGKINEGKLENQETTHRRADHLDPKQVESGIPVVDVPHEHNLFQGNSAEKPNSAA